MIELPHYKDALSGIQYYFSNVLQNHNYRNHQFKLACSNSIEITSTPSAKFEPGIETSHD